MNYLYTRCIYLLDMQATLFHSEWCTYLDKYWLLDNEWLQNVQRMFKADSIKIFLKWRNVDGDTDCWHPPWTEHVGQCRRLLFNNYVPFLINNNYILGTHYYYSYFYISTIFNSIHTQPQTDTEVGKWLS